ncbi:hypothetical protein [Streptomyces sp. NPDC057596]|uniref:hypothetical protein n=1 Tax=Streptomyces sp. NPDC057596 TaxID=3346178 RepID=UPI0036AED38C
MNPVHGGPGWNLSWSNAGHPTTAPPHLRRARHPLTERDILQHQGFGRSTAPSTGAESLRSTLLLCTGGQIERPDHSIDAASRN